MFGTTIEQTASRILNVNRPTAQRLSCWESGVRALNDLQSQVGSMSRLGIVSQTRAGYRIFLAEAAVGSMSAPLRLQIGQMILDPQAIMRHAETASEEC